MKGTLFPIACVVALLASVAPCAGGGSWSLDLNGTWRHARSAIADAPPAGAEWHEVDVPGFVAWERQLPVSWFRRSFTLPRDMPRQHLFLCFEGVKYASRVFVNGIGVGGHIGGFEPFETDVTVAVRDGTNELLVRAHDWTGLVEGGVDWDEVTLRPGARVTAAAKDRLMYPVGSQTSRMGVWQDVALVSRPDVYVEDAFVRTSVREGEITVSVTVRNLTDAQRRVRIRPVVVNKDAERVEKRLGSADVEVPAAGSTARSFDAPWPDPKLWWPDRPKLYFLHATLENAGPEARATDFGPPHETRFGFREFGVEDGIHFTLNGRRTKFLATAGHPTSIEKAVAVDTFLKLKDANVVAFRLHAQPWGRAWYDAADEVGMLIVHESAIWCESNSYALSKPRFWGNFRDHLQAQMKIHMNRPSVVIWSLENELLHCGGDRVPDCERRLAQLGRFVKKLDPTRLVMYDADADPGGVADVVNLHYSHEYPEWTLWPQTGEWVDRETKVSGWPRREWKWHREKPLYMGEFMWVPSQNPRAQTVFFGDRAYLDPQGSRRRGKIFAWGMQVEAFRRLEVSGMCPWTIMEIGGEMYDVARPMYEPHAAIVREYDWRFFAGDRVSRTLTVHNDVMRECDVALAWSLATAPQAGKGERVHCRGEIPLGKMRSAGMCYSDLGFRAPAVRVRTDMVFRLVVTADGREAYRIEKPCTVYPRTPLRPPADPRIALWDPAGGTARALAEAGLRPERVADLGDMPAGTDVLLVGSKSFRKRAGDVPVVGEAESDAVLVAEFAGRGGAVIVFEQEHYPDELPGTLSAESANFTFAREGYDELFAGISERHLRWWRGDNVVARRNLVRPKRGGYRVLVEAGSGEGLVHAPLLEVPAGPSGQGSFIFSQLALAEKMNAEPVARILVQRLLGYASRPRERAKPVAIVSPGDAGEAVRAKLTSLGVVTVDVDAADLSTEGHAAAVCDVSSPGFLPARDAVDSYVRNGGVAILRGITEGTTRLLGPVLPEGLTFRPRGALPLRVGEPDRLTRGLTNESLYWHAEHTGSWRTATPLTGDIASLELSRGAAPGGRVKVDLAKMRPRKLKYWRRLSAEAGEGIHMSTSGGVFTEIDFPRTAAYVFRVMAGGTPAFGIYPIVAIRIDGRKVGGVVLSRGEVTDYSLVAEVERGRREVELVFTNDTWNPPKEDRNLVIGGFAFGPAAELPRGVKLLTKPGCLAKIERGRGCYVIDLVNWASERRNAGKAGRVATAILMNCGARFRPHAGGTRVSGASMEPMPGISGHRRQGDVASLAANGWIARTVRFARGGEYDLSLTARGTELGGVYPHFELRLDGETVGRVALRTGGPETHTVRARVEAGERKVAVAFVNDKWDPPADRNAWVEDVTITKVPIVVFPEHVSGN